MGYPVLVLNSNFEPINVCDLRRAIGLLICDKASMVILGNGMIRSSYNAFPKPSVIRLKNMIRRPRPQVRLTRREVFRRDNFTCQYCGKKTKNLTIDHVVPKHVGGPQSWTNVVASCPTCNHRKGGKYLMDTNMRLLKRPIEPPSSAMYIFEKHVRENETWEQFLEGW
ncbi:MAG: HNH endonuclease [Anaerolineaceae bacterium]|nr:HNH endonuclease [Anaerolineaceae bacterium]